jgi:LAS superfamily LD-carboxypeptidase LdcB
MRQIADNAYRFASSLRYPPDKAEITGCANEPWHLRYVAWSWRPSCTPAG